MMFTNSLIKNGITSCFLFSPIFLERKRKKEIKIMGIKDYTSIYYTTALYNVEISKIIMPKKGDQSSPGLFSPRGGNSVPRCN